MPLSRETLSTRNFSCQVQSSNIIHFWLKIKRGEYFVIVWAWGPVAGGGLVWRRNTGVRLRMGGSPYDTILATVRTTKRKLLGRNNVYLYTLGWFGLVYGPWGGLAWWVTLGSGWYGVAIQCAVMWEQQEECCFRDIFYYCRISH